MNVMKVTRRIVLIAAFLAFSCVHAQDQAPDQADNSEDPAAPPPIPPKLTEEQVEPSVIIRKEEDRLIEEYSLNGQVYMVKVTPDKGIPYYYLDEDGDGQLELQPGDDALNPVRPAFWKIKEW